MSDIDTSPDLIPLHGATLVSVSEPDGAQRKREARLREITVGAPSGVRIAASGFIALRPDHIRPLGQK